jgi:hypothetical protein
MIIGRVPATKAVGAGCVAQVVVYSGSAQLNHWAKGYLPLKIMGLQVVTPRQYIHDHWAGACQSC